MTYKNSGESLPASLHQIYVISHEKKKAHKLKKNPWFTGQVSLGLPAGQTAGVPGIFLLFAIDQRASSGGWDGWWQERLLSGRPDFAFL